MELCLLTDSNDEIKSNLENFKNSNDISSTSINNLISNLEKKLENQNLNCNSREILEKYVGNLKFLQDKFKYYKNTKFTDKTNKDFKELYTKLNNSFESDFEKNIFDGIYLFKSKLLSIIDNEQKNVEDNIFSEFVGLDISIRDQVENNISFEFFSPHSSYVEIEIVGEFLNIFTIEYINFLDSKNLNRKELDLDLKLDLTIDELNKILEKVSKTKGYKFYCLGEIEFELKDGVSKKIDFKSYGKPENKEKNIDINQEDKKQVSKQKKDNGTKTSNNTNEIIYDKNISYKEFLKDGIPENVLEVGEGLITKILKIEINDKNREKIYNNLKIFLSFISDMESDGRNIKNMDFGKKEYVEGYFQYKTGDMKGGYNSLENAIRRVYNYYTGKPTLESNKLTKNIDKIPEVFIEAYNNKKYNLLNMSVDKQTIMFLCDIFYKKGTSIQLENMLLNGNGWSMRRLYEDFHHTTKKGTKKTNDRTESRTEKYIKKWWNKLYAKN